VGMVVLGAIMSLAVGCPDDVPDVAGIAGTGGRSRYVVTLDLPPPDLAEYRALVRDKPDEVEAYVKKKRQETANAQANLDVVVKSLGGHIVARWWMTGQATVEVSPTSIATMRQAPGVKDIVPDTPLK